MSTKMNKTVYFIIAILFISFISCGTPELYRKGDEAFQKKNYISAINNYSNFIKEEPEDDLIPEAKSKIRQSYYHIGLKLFNNQEYKRAVENFEKSKWGNFQEKINECYYKMGLKELNNKNYSRAITYFELSKFQDYNNKILESKFNLAQEAYEQKKYDKALEYLPEIQEVTDDNLKYKSFILKFEIYYKKKDEDSYLSALKDIKKFQGQILNDKLPANVEKIIIFGLTP